jgi:DNA-binding CsgD family transcriptional regulator
VREKNNQMTRQTSQLRTSPKISLDYETKRGLCRMARSGYPDLTRRETEVLQFFLYGLTAQDIALALETSGSSITSKHLPNIRKKFGVENNVDLVLACVWLGFVEPGLKKAA